MPKVWLDRQEIEHALNELLDNAVKYSPEGGRIDVTAAVGTDFDGQEVVRISVTDRGIGIPADRSTTSPGTSSRPTARTPAPSAGSGSGSPSPAASPGPTAASWSCSSTTGPGHDGVTLVLPIDRPDGGRL